MASDDDILALYEIEWALEQVGSHRQVAVVDRLGVRIVAALILCAATWILSRELALFLTSGFPR